MKNTNAILEIYRKNLIYNYKAFEKISKNKIIAATIKADAYGLGDSEIYKTLYTQKCRHFFVATFSEALKLRKKYSRGNIYVLNGTENLNLNEFFKNNIIPILVSLDEIKLFINNKDLSKKHKIGIQLDTGINRLGIKINKIKNNNFKKLNLYILISHLSSSEKFQDKYNILQNKQFKNSLNLFNKIKYKSIANSMALLLGKNYYYDILRPGISLYGGHYNNKMKKIIKPVIKLKAKILQIKIIEKNEYVGYNKTFKTNKKTKIAILGIGYADGIFRYLSNKGKVFYKGKKFNIIGRISMDTITIDISNDKNNLKSGMYLDLINFDHGIDEIANKCNTISNEILTSISNRVTRIYK